MTVRQSDREVGIVTSGCLSPTLGYPIAMAYVDADQSGRGPGTDSRVGLKISRCYCGRFTVLSDEVRDLLEF